jgi:putative spermidine/putrescine transport system ATP-binding protein
VVCAREQYCQKVATLQVAWQDHEASGEREPVNDALARVKSRDALVRFIGVEKSYDGHTLAVRGLTLDVAQGEFLTLLGPSGSGKTTTLNMLAGFERPTRGEILLSGRPVDRLPPYERNIGMVFQNYALFPHMSVAENVAFPLRVRRIARDDIAGRVRRALAMVRLEAFAERRPAQLSGGQQQRIALARALVFEPSLVLMDEPLGALDKKLREQMQIEIKLLHERLGLTVVYVTHDQSEALTMSDRVAVFRDGEVIQKGTPDSLYSQPRDPFVASFVGENNMLMGTAGTVANGYVRVELAGGMQFLAVSVGEMETGTQVVVAVRPEAIRLSEVGEKPAENRCNALVRSRIYLGDHQRLLTEIDNGLTVKVKVATSAATATNAPICLSWSAADCLAFPATGLADDMLNGETLNKEWRSQ